MSDNQFENEATPVKGKRFVLEWGGGVMRGIIPPISTDKIFSIFFGVDVK